MKASLPRIITRDTEVAGLLAEARTVTSLILRLGEVQTLGAAARSPRNGVTGPDEGVPGRSALSSAILAAERSNELGHAPAWIDAASAYEDLVGHVEREGPAQFVFCLDPWSAQLLTHANELMPEARWIAVTDLGDRKAGEHGDYWESLEGWIAQLPFEWIVDQDAWDTALRGVGEEGPGPSLPHPSGRVYLERPGAWGWRTVVEPTAEQDPAFGDILLLTKYSGSLPHIRVLLESLARQSCPKRSLCLVILAPSEATDLRSYLRWFALAQPEVRLKLVEAAPGPHDWEEFNRQLHGLAPAAAAVALDDYAILPTDFCLSVHRTVCAAHRRVRYASMTIEASAHVITGNLDAVAEYEKLLQAFAHSDSEAKDAPVHSSGWIVSPQAWKSGAAADLERLVQGERHLSSSNVARPTSFDPVLLRLSDLG